MCEPTTIMTVASLAIAAAGTAYSIDAGNKAADAQEEQAVENAKGAENQAKAVELGAQVDEDRQRARTRQMLASQRTTFAANNLDMSVGTPTELLGDTAAMGEQDALTIRANAARQAWGLRSQGVGYLNDAAVGQSAAKNNAVGSILTTGSQMASTGASMYGNRAGSTNYAAKKAATNVGTQYRGLGSLGY